MPPEFDRRLEELGIPFETRGKNTLIPPANVPLEDLIRALGLADASALAELLRKIAEETDARLVMADGDQFHFGPKQNL